MVDGLGFSECLSMADRPPVVNLAIVYQDSLLSKIHFSRFTISISKRFNHLCSSLVRIGCLGFGEALS